VSAIRFSILGSCVTSDVFRFASDLGPLASYHARTSILSIMSPPRPLADDELDWSSNFARRAMQADFAKTFFDDLEAASPDYLIVDFVDDRFPLLRCGASWFVRSQCFVDCGGDRMTRHRLVNVPRSWLGLRPLWRDACGRFASTFRRRFPDLPVVVHRARGLPSPDGSRTSCDGLEIGVLNRLLDEYATWFADDIEPALDLRLPGPYVPDPEHRWGDSPFHYEERYYRDVADRLRALPPPPLARSRK
jgi:hypothetical protein